MSKEVQIEDVPAIAADIAYAESVHAADSWLRNPSLEDLATSLQEIGETTRRRVNLYEKLETGLDLIERSRRPIMAHTLSKAPEIVGSYRDSPNPVLYSEPRVEYAVGFIAFYGIGDNYLRLVPSNRDRQTQKELGRAFKFYARMFDPETFEPTIGLSLM